MTIKYLRGNDDQERSRALIDSDPAEDRPMHDPALVTPGELLARFDEFWSDLSSADVQDLAKNGAQNNPELWLRYRELDQLRFAGYRPIR